MKAFQKSLAIAAFFLFGTLLAQERSKADVCALMIFNFTRYIQWPDNNTAGEFVIGVMGNTEIYNVLNNRHGGKPRSSQVYVIKKISSVAEVTKCHVIFIDNSMSSEFEAVNNKIKGSNTLLVTDQNGLGEKGSAINFKTVDNKLKFELNQKVIESSGLRVSTSLTSLAILI
jgi:hypothetical protein